MAELAGIRVIRVQVIEVLLCYFKIDVTKHWQPMMLKENWRDTVLLPCVHNKSCGSVLDSGSGLTDLILIWATHKVNYYKEEQTVIVCLSVIQ